MNGSTDDVGVGVERLTITYQQKHKVTRALDDVSVTVRRGDLLVLLGPSGSGKSTLLNGIAGLLTPTEGRITVAGRDVFRSGRGAINLPPNDRNLGMIFQAYSLWPHMSVAENVAYPLKRRGRPQAEITKRVTAALELVRCDHLAGQHPGQLSGGQQQRIALARAIVAEPAVLLFDEPLSNLDANLRHQLRNEIAALHGRLGFSGVYVTHDQAEALSLGTHVAVMNTARIEQIGTPRQIHDQPATAYVASFMGANVFDGTAVASAAVDTVFGRFGSAGPVPSGPVSVAAFPQRIAVVRNPGGRAGVVQVRYMGTSVEYTLAAGDTAISVIAPTDAETLGPGERVDLVIRPENVLAFPKPG